MKKVVLLDMEEFRTLKVLLHDAKINLDKCDTSFNLGEAHRKIEEAIEILRNESDDAYSTEKGGVDE